MKNLSKIEMLNKKSRKFTLKYVEYIYIEYQYDYEVSTFNNSS